MAKIFKKLFGCDGKETYCVGDGQFVDQIIRNTALMMDWSDAESMKAYWSQAQILGDTSLRTCAGTPKDFSQQVTIKNKCKIYMKQIKIKPKVGFIISIM